LAFIAAHLRSTPKTDSWLAFAVQELVKEVEHQFYPDGGNFEGSTAYHRLSAEMVYYTTALILGLPKERMDKLKDYDHTALKTGWGKPNLKPAPILFHKLPKGTQAAIEESPFPDWYFERTERMAELIMDITKPSGHISQIGDNDSGRFFKLGPIYERMSVKQAKEKYANLEGYNELPDDATYYMEDHLDCRHILASAYALFKREDFAILLGGGVKASYMPDCLVARALAKHTFIGSRRFAQRCLENNDTFVVGRKDDCRKIIADIKKKDCEQVQITEYECEKGDLTQDISLRAYQDFGLYLYRSPNLYLSLRCWPGRKPFRAGHMHDDQLSIELVINGKEQVSDPGTYIYTPLPEIRALYRSSESHYTPVSFFQRDSKDRQKVFSTSSQPVCSEVVLFSNSSILAKRTDCFEQARYMEILSDRIRLTDISDVKPMKLSVHFSQGYGIRLKQKSFCTDEGG
jgi:hypothetical protein